MSLLKQFITENNDKALNLANCADCFENDEMVVPLKDVDSLLSSSLKEFAALVKKDLQKMADDLENATTTLPQESEWNSALRQSGAKIKAYLSLLNLTD